MPVLRQVPSSEAKAEDRWLRMYDLLFGDRDPVAQPGTATGTPGDWWTVFALVLPDILKHAVDGFAVYRHPEPARSTPCCANSARPAPAG